MKHITQNPLSKASIIALFVFTLGMAGAIAAPNHNQASSFRLLLPPTGEHVVVVDNITYTQIYDRFKLDNLRPGNHRLKIVQLVINRRGQIVKRILLYNGMVFIPKGAKVWASVANNGHFMIERTYRQNNNNRGGNNRHRYDNRDYDDHCNDYNDGGNREDKRDDYYDDDWYGYNYQDDDNRNDNNNRGSDQRYGDNTKSNNNQSLALTLNAIKKQSFDTERLKIAKNAVSYGDMLSSEVAEITKLLSFESSRLEFAKYAYNYTVDKKNYVIVQDAFQFSSSTSELQDYIAGQGNL